jgi:hypothetical protein
LGGHLRQCGRALPVAPNVVNTAGANDGGVAANTACGLNADAGGSANTAIGANSHADGASSFNTATGADSNASGEGSNNGATGFQEDLAGASLIEIRLSCVSREV